MHILHLLKLSWAQVQQCFGMQCVWRIPMLTLNLTIPFFPPSLCSDCSHDLSTRWSGEAGPDKRCHWWSRGQLCHRICCHGSKLIIPCFLLSLWWSVNCLEIWMCTQPLCCWFCWFCRCNKLQNMLKHYSSFERAKKYPSFTAWCGIWWPLAFQTMSYISMHWWPTILLSDCDVTDSYRQCSMV